MKKLFFLLLGISLGFNSYAQNDQQIIQRFINEVSSYNQPNNFAPATLEIGSKLLIKELESQKTSFRRISIIKTNLSEIIENIIFLDSTELKLDRKKQVVKLNELTNSEIWAVNYEFIPNEYEKTHDKGYAFIARIEFSIAELKVFNHLKSRTFWIDGEFSKKDNLTIFVYDSMSLKNIEIKDNGVVLCPLYLSGRGNSKNKKVRFMGFLPARYNENGFENDPSEKAPIAKISTETSFVISGNSITLELWDYGKVDGDIVYVDGILHQKNLRLVDHKFIVTISVPNKSASIIIEAVNEGFESPCTVRIKIIEINKEFTLSAKTGELMKIALSKDD